MAIRARAANSRIIPDRVGVSKFGWRNKDTEFICPGMNNNYVLDTDDIAPQLVIDGYLVDGDHNIWLQAMGELRKNPKARFILPASFVAPLLKITGQRIFGIHNWGIHEMVSRQHNMRLYQFGVNLIL